VLTLSTISQKKKEPKKKNHYDNDHSDIIVI